MRSLLHRGRRSRQSGVVARNVHLALRRDVEGLDVLDGAARESARRRRVPLERGVLAGRRCAREEGVLARELRLGELGAMRVGGACRGLGVDGLPTVIRTSAASAMDPVAGVIVPAAFAAPSSSVVPAPRSRDPVDRSACAEAFTFFVATGVGGSSPGSRGVSTVERAAVVP